MLRGGVYLLAFFAQAVTDEVPHAIRERLARGVSLRENLVATLWINRVDAVLWPIGLLTAIVAYDNPIAVVFVGPLVWLLGTFARERRERYSAALELNRAYRGTVMLLSDVVEADDNYTADHCRGVVSLVTTVADELEIDEDSRQELEFVALLHDVGKIVIPKDILNKPGALSDDEFELMKTHTIEGQVLLDRVGGLLGRVGAVVRSCHERWDGHGYPDGLAGYEIPLARPHRVRLRRLQRHDHRPPLPRGDEPGDCHRGAVGQRGHPVRPAHRGRAGLGDQARRRRRALPRARRAHRARGHGRDGRATGRDPGCSGLATRPAAAPRPRHPHRPPRAEARTDAP